MPQRANLRRARLAMKMTQKQLASHIGLVRTAVTAIENGRASGSEATWRKLAAVLQKPVEHLWQLDSEPGEHHDLPSLNCDSCDLSSFDLSQYGILRYDIDDSGKPIMRLQNFLNRRRRQADEPPSKLS